MAHHLHEYAYARPSALDGGRADARLALETSGGSTPAGPARRPRFFTGFLTRPAPAAAALLAVADVAAARYHRPDLARLRDPVVTAQGDRLRFESFSGCGGVYARLDLLGDGLDGGEILHGTTNVDVNNPLRDALARFGGGADPLHLRVGPDEMAVTTLDGRTVEKKVPLPGRWLRGFAEVQAVSAGFELRGEAGAAETVRFLRALPRTARSGEPARWVVPAGGALRPTSRPVPGAVCLPGPARLGALLRVLRHATGLRVYGGADVSGGAPAASAWEVALPGMRLTLVLSPGVARGFSGEGAILEDLAGGECADDADLLSVLLAWDPRIDPADLAAQSGLDRARVRAALAQLGTSGRIGYDCAEAAYFHRELPYDQNRAVRDNPRLAAARRLLAEGAVSFPRQEPAEDPWGPGRAAAGPAAPEVVRTAAVRSEDQVRRVRLGAGDTVLGCTCRWWTDHQGRRGPCKHALAVRMAVRGAAADGAALEETSR